jgi:hypothetical protein
VSLLARVAEVVDARLPVLVSDQETVDGVVDVVEAAGRTAVPLDRKFVTSSA